MKQFTSPRQIIGEKGEKIALKFLIDKGFQIIERNYTKKIGEIDIIAQKGNVIHFIEVKTIVSRLPAGALAKVGGDNTFLNDQKYNPFENVTSFKLKKLSRTIEWYLAERHVSRETSWVIDAIAVIINEKERSAKIEVLWNVIK